MSAARTPPLDERLIGALIEDVQPHRDVPGAFVLSFRHRGTDDDSGYLILDESQIHFGDDDA